MEQIHDQESKDCSCFKSKFQVHQHHQNGTYLWSRKPRIWIFLKLLRNWYLNLFKTYVCMWDVQLIYLWKANSILSLLQFVVMTKCNSWQLFHSFMIAIVKFIFNVISLLLKFDKINVHVKWKNWTHITIQ